MPFTISKTPVAPAAMAPPLLPNNLLSFSKKSVVFPKNPSFVKAFPIAPSFVKACPIF
jgi:hypothetical protein